MMTQSTQSDTKLAVGLRRALSLLVMGALLAGLAGCNSLKWLVPDSADSRVVKAGPRLPDKYHLRIAPYFFHSDFELRRDDPLFRELAGLRDQVYSELRLTPGTADVHVYLFETRERYQGYMNHRYPELEPRRAWFVVQPRGMGGGADDLLVFTFWGDKDKVDPDRVRQDLRHELTHGLLHCVLKDVPIWVDEGLAEYFELPPGRKGVNLTHVENLRRPGGFLPDLGRMEKLTKPEDMKPPEYREAWAWVHLMLNSTPEARAVFLQYVHQFKNADTPAPLKPRLTGVFPSPDDALERHLRALEAQATVTPTSGNR